MGIFSAISKAFAKVEGKVEEQAIPKNPLFEDFDATVERLKNFDLEPSSGDQPSQAKSFQTGNSASSRIRQS